MGGGKYDSATYVNYAVTSGLIDKKGVATNKAAAEIFTASQVNQALNPFDVKVRESRDSNDHPVSNAIILALDVTGSMGFVAKQIAQVGLLKLMKEIYTRKPVIDPQILFMGFDDIECQGHFQVSQFESDIRIAEQLLMLWLENGGGGNNYESYALPWLFAAKHTSIDCWEKRGKKGYLFTIGDEEPTPKLHKKDVNRILGYSPQGKLDSATLLENAQKSYNVFHIVAEEGSHARSSKNEVRSAWEELMGGNVLFLPDHTRIAELVVSTIQIAEGADPDDVAGSWEDKHTASVVKLATKTVKRIVEV